MSTEHVANLQYHFSDNLILKSQLDILLNFKNMSKNFVCTEKKKKR